MTRFHQILLIGTWNGLGPDFGLGKAAGKVDHGGAYVSCGLLLLTVILGLLLSTR